MSDAHCISAEQPREIVTRAQARERGLKHYFTGKPCKHGHIERRAIMDGGCLACARSAQALRRAADPEAARQANIAWRNRHPEMVKEHNRRSIERHGAQRKQITITWRSKNKDQIAAYVRRYRLEKAEVIKARRAAARKKSSYKILGLKHQAERRVRKMRSALLCGELDDLAIFEAYHLARLRTTTTGIAWHVDHMIPLAAREASGLHCAFNLQVIPQFLNLSKHNRMVLTEPGEWIGRL